MAFDLEGIGDILVCPKSQSRMVFHESYLVCTDPECRLAFPVEDNIPRLLISDATELEQDDWTDIIEQAKNSAVTNEDATSENE